MLPGLGESGGRLQDMGWSFIAEINLVAASLHIEAWVNLVVGWYLPGLKASHPWADALVAILQYTEGTPEVSHLFCGKLRGENMHEPDCVASCACSVCCTSTGCRMGHQMTFNLPDDCHKRAPR